MQTYRDHDADVWPDWSAATSIDDMGELVIDWLQGRTTALPWHVGPPDEETASIRTHLVAFNRLGGVISTNSQPGVEADGNRQRAWVSGRATPAKLKILIDRAERAGLVVLTDPRIGPNDPVITEPLSGEQGLTTYARAEPLSELALPAPAAKVLNANSLPFSIHDPQWGTNTMCDRLLEGRRVIDATEGTKSHSRRDCPDYIDKGLGEADD